MMQIVINSDRIAVFFGDVGPIRLEADGCHIGPYFNPTHNSSNCELLDVEPPEYLYPGLFKRDGDSWSVVDENQYQGVRLEFIKRHNASMKQKRREAYVTESDPYFFKYQRGEVAKYEWEAKVEDIRNRYPLMDDPTEPQKSIPVAEFT